MQTISIEVTPDIAAKIRFLAESGAFAIETGNVTINITKKEFKSIKTETFTYPMVMSTSGPVAISIEKGVILNR